jgi:amino acid transporter
MLIIANSYRRLNMWNANCGASFEWVGRAINPYLGFLTGWLMIVAYIIGTVSGVEVLGPSVLAVFGHSTASSWAYVGIGAAVVLVMLVIAIIGIKITARTQVGLAVIEYSIVIGFAIAGLVYVFGHHHGVVHPTTAWLRPSGIGGKGSAVAGFLAAVFVYGGWDGSMYVNEEVKHRRINPGRAAIFAVAFLAIFYTLAQVGLQGVVSPKQLANNSASAPVYIAGVLGGSSGAKAMALAIALSVIATVGTGIVLTARIIYGMASYRVLPEFLSNVSRRYATPVWSSIVVGFLLIAIAAVYLLTSSVQNAFDNVIAVTGLLFSIFYILTALAMIVYYRRRVLRSVWDTIMLGILPLGAAGFLGWVLVKSIIAAPSQQKWSLIGIIVLGVLLMLSARFIQRSPFFQISRESDSGQATARHA